MNDGKSILVWVIIWFIMAKEIRKGNEKGFGKAKWHFWQFIYENNENSEKREVKGHNLHVRRKMKENNGN